MSNPVFLRKVFLKCGDTDQYPYDTDLFSNGDIEFAIEKPVTIICGDNGSGKSTLLKAIAENMGFSELGGSSAHHINKVGKTFNHEVRLSWLPKVSNGFFFRADKLSTFSNYIDNIAKDGDATIYDSYGGKSLNTLSHGEAVGTIIAKFSASSKRRAVLILDEPESALSPESQISLVKIIHEATKSNTQFLISTHSPIIMATPESMILSIDKNGISRTEMHQTKSYLLTREFIKRGSSFFDFLKYESSED